MIGGDRSLCSNPSSSNVSSSSSMSPASSSPVALGAAAARRLVHGVQSSAAARMAGRGSTSSASWISSNGSSGRRPWKPDGACASSRGAAVPGPIQRRRGARAQLGIVVQQRAGQAVDARPAGRQVRGRGAGRDRRPRGEPTHAHPRQQPVGRGAEGRASRVALQRAILAGAGRCARQRRAGQHDRAFTQRVAGEPARASPHRRGRQQRGPEQKAGQGPIHVARVTQLRRSARSSLPGPSLLSAGGIAVGVAVRDLGGEPDAHDRDRRQKAQDRVLKGHDVLGGAVRDHHG